MVSVGVQTNFVDNSKRVLDATKKANFKNIGNALASIRKVAVKSIEKAPQGVPSDPGSPPHTHKGTFFRRALRFHVDKQKQDGVMGFRHSIIGESASIHEFGRTVGGVKFPERAVIAPALEMSLGRIAGQWRSSIGP